MACPHSALTRSLYRSLLHEFRHFSREPRLESPSSPTSALLLLLREPIDPREYGRHKYVEDSRRRDVSWVPDDVQKILNRNRKVERTAFSSEDMRDICRREFRRSSSLKDEKAIQNRRGLILDISSFYSKQLALDRCSSLSTTNGVQVEATSSYLGVSSASTVKLSHVFLYRIRITNWGRETVKLLTRYWRTVDDDGRIEETPKNSPGVLGQYPQLSEKQSFVYTSATRLQTDNGVMMGSFQVKELSSDETFDVEVQPFRLSRKCAVVIGSAVDPL